MKKKTSEWRTVTSGVPEEALLAPLLFALYINDLPMAVPSSHCVVFSDDVKRFLYVFNILDMSRFILLLLEVAMSVVIISLRIKGSLFPRELSRNLFPKFFNLFVFSLFPKFFNLFVFSSDTEKYFRCIWVYSAISLFRIYLINWENVIHVPNTEERVTS